MPRNPQRVLGSRKYKDFSNEQLQKALNAVSSGLSLRKAEEKFGIPRCSINRAVRGINACKVGRPYVLDEEDQEVLVSCICSAGDWGFPLTTYDIRLIVKGYLDRSGRNEPRFKDNMPGREFVFSFLQRHKASLSNKMCQNIKRSRAKVDREAINDYFNELTITLEGVTPNLMINYDETNITDDPGRKKVVVRRGCRHPERIIDSTKSSTSVMFCAASDGTLLPAYVCYKAENLYNSWTENGPKGAVYNRSKSGWFTLEIFEDWFRKVALPYFSKFNPDAKKIMIGDNLASHISPFILQECKENNINFVLLPPNSTGLTQPLDVAFFRPLKIKWRATLDEWKTKNRGTVPKDRFPRLLKKCLDEMGNDNISKNVISGFKGAGINPLDREQVLKRLPKREIVSDEMKEANSSMVWVSTFQEFLEESRKKETSCLRQQKKKKLNVPPGRGVTAEDLNILSDNTQNKTKKTKSKKRAHVTSDEEEGSEESLLEENMLCADSSDDDLETFKTKTLERMEEEEIEEEEGLNQPSFQIINKQIGAFVVVKYEGKFYPGVIESFDEGGANISAMVKTPKSNWKWPNSKDELFYEWGDILGGINPPKMLNKRGLFAVPELIPFD